MNINTTLPIILASKSPRRAELLQNIIRNLSIVPSLFDETSVQTSSPEKYVKILSLCKTNNITKLYPNNWIIGADTIVVLGKKILGKPHNKEESLSMIKSLNGKVHQVYTGYSIRHLTNNKSITKAVITHVEFKKMNLKEIERYVTTGESLDKSGGYAIQGIGSFFVKRINGSYTNVMGLPICEVVEDLLKMDIIKL